MAWRDDVGVSIFTLHINPPSGVYRGSVNAPFEAVRVIGNTSKSPVRIGGTTVRLGAVELPLRREVGVELRDIEMACRNTRRCTDGIADATGRVAVKAPLLIIVVVLDHNG